jgi:hypothetical protein
MDVISILIIPVCGTSTWLRVGGNRHAHCTHGNEVLQSPYSGFETRQLMKFIQASATLDKTLDSGGSPGSGPQPCASRKRTSSSCSIVYPAKILTILCPNGCEPTPVRKTCSQ